MIVSNPPYIPESDIHLTQGDVRFEPRSALVAGHDGLSDLRRILPQAHGCLRPGGWLLVEHGHDQGEVLQALFKANGYQQVQGHKDLAGQDRITLGQRQR